MDLLDMNERGRGAGMGWTSETHETQPGHTRIRPGTILTRAIRLVCPNCGRGRLFLSWFRMRDACPSCGLRLQRGEEADYWVGGWLINFMIAEVTVAVMIALLVWILWPDVPWNGVLYGTGAAAIVAPLLTWPVSRTLWLGIDLVFRPAEPHEFGEDRGAER